MNEGSLSVQRREDLTRRLAEYIHRQTGRHEPVPNWLEAETKLKRYFGRENGKNEDFTMGELEQRIRGEFDRYLSMLTNEMGEGMIQIDKDVIPQHIFGMVLFSDKIGEHPRTAFNNQLEKPDNILSVQKDGKIAYIVCGYTSDYSPLLALAFGVAGKEKVGHGIEMLDGSMQIAFKMPSSQQGKERLIGVETGYSEKGRELRKTSLIILDYGKTVDKDVLRRYGELFGIADLKEQSDVYQREHLAGYLSRQLQKLQ